MENLKPCPFCGEPAHIDTFTTSMEKIPRFRAKCDKCFCETDWDNFSVEEVTEKWNRRTDDGTAEY